MTHYVIILSIYTLESQLNYTSSIDTEFKSLSKLNVMLSILYYKCSIDTSFKTNYSTFDVHCLNDYSEMKNKKLRDYLSSPKMSLLILSI